MEGSPQAQGDAAPVATPEMCHYCFDVLLRELIPEEAFRRGRAPSGRRPSRKARASVDGDVDGDDDEYGIDRDRGIDGDDVGGLGDRLECRPSYVLPPVDCPLFVTWSKSRRPYRPSSFGANDAPPASAATSASDDGASSSARDGGDDDDADCDLRGCIGTLSPRPLDTALSEFAIASALHDARFDPVALREVPRLTAGVSLLVDYEACRDPTDWEVGVHGIIIKFHDRDGRAYGATYLPEVAAEQGWGRREAVTSLARKAGYRGTIDEGLLASMRCTRYKSSKCRAGYGEYVRARHGGRDPLRDAGGALADAAGADEALRRRARGTRPCVHL